MQHICKKNYLYFNYTSNFYSISTIFITITIMCLIFSGCSILTQEKKIFFNKLYYLNKKNIKNNTQENLSNNNIKMKFFNNKKIYPSYLNPRLSNHTFIKKTINIKKNSNFYRSAYAKGLNLSEINTIIKAMEWQISFRKLHIDSSFDLIFLQNENHLKNNKNILLGIKLKNLTKTYYAIRANNGNFYDINGFNKSQMIMDFSLLKKYRISSYFNLHRIHPITHHISRHLGVDLAMPKGTVVLATSNGTIIKTAFNNISGLYIVLNHNNQYMTKYMHLKKILVQVGQKIKINQKIALSGNTGRTTGPHLHYEIWINQRAINPILARSKFIEPLQGEELRLYFKISQIILSQLK